MIILNMDSYSPHYLLLKQHVYIHWIDNYPLDNRFIRWVGVICWISHPTFKQPAPEVLITVLRGCCWSVLCPGASQ